LQQAQIVVFGRQSDNRVAVAAVVDVDVAINQAGHQREVREIESLRLLGAWHSGGRSNFHDALAINKHSTVENGGTAMPVNQASGPNVFHVWHHLSLAAAEYHAASVGQMAEPYPRGET
jgi:hypothetical protein